MSAAATFQSAQPFPHVVIDDFIPAPMVRAINAEWPQDPWRNHHHEYSAKRACADYRAFGAATRKLLDWLNDGFVFQLKGHTGIDGLVADVKLAGGGLHETLTGGFLGIHADFNIHPETGLYRRLNLLLFLNEEWREEWGGALELWDANKKPAKVIQPIGGRCVIFATNDKSFHGHPEPLACPEGRTRRSIALYYYSPQREGDLPRPHSTLYLKEKETWKLNA